MQISYNWLKNFVEITETPEVLAQILTSIGLEIEAIDVFESIKGGLRGVVIGEVLSCEKHPNADKLSKTTVAIENGVIVPIVCGAPNVALGQKVVVATVGTTLYPSEGEPFTIKKAKIRGEESEGMICAEDELGLGKSHEGIIVLDTKLANGTPASIHFGLATDYIFSIGLTPNRTDAMSHYGVARDLAAKLDRPCKYFESPALTEGKNSLPIKVEVLNSDACPRYTGVSLVGITVKESPNWLQNFLKSMGLKPINNLVDITNFVLHEFGQPLHAFDADKITDKHIVVKNLPQDTLFTSLDGQQRKLSANDLMICDAQNFPLCIGGVFGGLQSGISLNTKNVFLESAHFSANSIRKSSQYHSLKTDASFRFERGTSPDSTLPALQRAVALILEIAGGEVASELIDIYPKVIAPQKITITWKNINRLIGKTLDQTWILALLKRLEFEITNQHDAGFIACVPLYRVDVLREADVIEEIARHYGYDNLELSEQLGTAYFAQFPKPDVHNIQFQITQLLAANGYSEIMTNSLTRASYLEGLSQYNSEANVQILNPLSEELNVMRQTLVFGGLEAIAYNVNRKQKDIKMFEFAKIYQRNTAKEGLDKYFEKTQLAIYLSGQNHAETWGEKAKDTDFFNLASIVQKILQKLNIQGYKTERIKTDIWADALAFKRGDKIFATLGIVQTKLLKKTDLKQATWYAELEWEYLLKAYKAEVGFTEISKFPEVQRDLSLVVDKKTTYAQISELAYKKEKKILKSINVFDVYEGQNIGADKKAYTLRFILEDKIQTLTDQMIDNTMQQLMDAYQNELGAVIRK